MKKFKCSGDCEAGPHKRPIVAVGSVPLVFTTLAGTHTAKVAFDLYFSQEKVDYFKVNLL